MPNVLVVGAQWGDEGKGRVVDHLAARASYAVRFGGGANAGHTLMVNGQKTVLHLIPAGALNPNCRGLIGNGCVADPEALLVEIDQLRAAGVAYGPDRLGISGRVHVVTAFHRAFDRAEGAAIGTTGRGIGPCYTDKAARRGLRLMDVLDGVHRPVLEAHVLFLKGNHDAKVILQGHADERGSREYNLALGQRRAESVYKVMSLLGVPEAQMEAVSLGEEKPLKEGHDESSWQENRRTELLYQGE